MEGGWVVQQGGEAAHTSHHQQQWGGWAQVELGEEVVVVEAQEGVAHRPNTF